MELQTLQASKRQANGSNSAGRQRRDGRVPGVLYGGDKEPVALSVDNREFLRLVHAGGAHAIVQINITDDAAASSPALLKDVQYHPVKGHVLHADFQRIRLDERITTLVPLNFFGHCKGVVDGGVLDYQLRELEIECLALEVPDKIDVDITNLGIGDHLYVSNITVPEGIAIVTDADRSVVACHAPRAMKEETTVAAEAAPGEEGAAAAAGAAESKPAETKGKGGESKGDKK